MKKDKLRVWWIPQIPGKPFLVLVSSIEEGVKLLDVLADYDIFQLKQNIKPDYCNAGGIEVFRKGEWSSWYDPETGEYDPKLFIAERAQILGAI